MNRLEHLKAMSTEQVSSWLDGQRAHWKIAIENTGIDGNIGSLVRSHNLFAGGGIDIIGRQRWNRRVSMGTYLYEPISYHQSIEQWREANPQRMIISVEEDPTLPPFDEFLFDDATYLLGHDAVGISPQTLEKVDFRVGPPRGWNRFAGPGLLGSMLMYSLRRMSLDFHGENDFFLHPENFSQISAQNRVNKSWIDTEFPPVSNRNNAFWKKGWETMTRKQQKETLSMSWWLHSPWKPLQDWWIWAPNVAYPLNRALLYRFCQASGFQGIICPFEKGLAHKENWKTMDTQTALQYFSANQYPIFGLEHGGENIMKKDFPHKGVLMIGNEKDGMQGYDQYIDYKITLPQYGSGRSFSAPLAGGMAMYAITSQATS